jgi:8-oxo-dGTP pyrophosphatase MutT (NUDIX family)
MILRDAPGGQNFEVFMVRRVIQSDFMPDVYVFPGGSVTKDDIATERTPEICREVPPSPADLDGLTALGGGVRAAAIRELFEEAGVLLAYFDRDMLAIDETNKGRYEVYRQGFNNRTGSLIEMAQTEKLVLATERLNYFAHWITPEVEGMPKRFDTHFFVTTAPEEQQAAYDQLETSEGVWITPAGALARSKDNDFPLVFPTVHQLQELATCSSVAEVLAMTSQTRVKVRMPVAVKQDGQTQIYLSEDGQNMWPIPEHLLQPQNR